MDAGRDFPKIDLDLLCCLVGGEKADEYDGQSDDHDLSDESHAEPKHEQRCYGEDGDRSQGNDEGAHGSTKNDKPPQDQADGGSDEHTKQKSEEDFFASSRRVCEQGACGQFLKETRNHRQGSGIEKVGLGAVATDPLPEEDNEQQQAPSQSLKRPLASIGLRRVHKIVS